MKTVVYDGSFEGLLTAVFDIYQYGFNDVKIVAESNHQPVIFGEIHQPVSDEEKFQRVYKGLKAKLSAKAIEQIYRAFLSEQPGIEDIILNYVRHTFKSKVSVEHDFSNPDVLEISQVARKVYREKHRMEAFVRFELTADGLYYAVIEPDFNVLPILTKHFSDRYADQKWMIYDARRKYGIFYDLNKVETIQISFRDDLNQGKDISSIYDSSEQLYQQLWHQYFNSVNIAARKNMKLHIQHMPQRYWKYLPEKDPGLKVKR